MASKEESSSSDRTKRKFRSQRFSKTKRKKHLQSLLEKKASSNLKTDNSTVIPPSEEPSTSSSIRNTPSQVEHQVEEARTVYEPTPKRSRSQLKIASFQNRLQTTADMESEEPYPNECV